MHSLHTTKVSEILQMHTLLYIGQGKEYLIDLFFGVKI